MTMTMMRRVLNACVARQKYHRIKPLLFTESMVCSCTVRGARHMSVLAVAVPRPRQPNLLEAGFQKKQCDFCKGSGIEMCDGCGLSMCKWHALATDDDDAHFLCNMCYQRAEPQCLDCNRPSTLKCALCPQRLCTKCTRTCSLVHAFCKQSPYCGDCAKITLKRCDACASLVCKLKPLTCHVCNIETAICTGCLDSASSQCDACSELCCRRCLGEHCGACDTKRCELCAHKLPFDHCMAQYCGQPVCYVCAAHCTGCESTTCNTHTPPQKSGCCLVCADSFSRAKAVN